MHVKRPPLHVRPGTSGRLAAFLFAAHGATALVLLAGVSLAWPWRVGLAAAVLIALAYAVGGHLSFRLPWVIREAVWEADGTWTLTLVSGRRLKALLLPSTYVSSWLVVLSFRCGRRRARSLVLLSDAVDAVVLRRLRSRLRLQGGAGGPDTPLGPLRGR